MYKPFTTSPALISSQVPAPLNKVGQLLSVPAAAGAAGWGLLRLCAPDMARSMRMWRQFTPIYLRYLWTRWRCRKESSMNLEVCVDL